MTDDFGLYNYRAKVIRIVDGDTYELMVDLGMKVFHLAHIRLEDVDTPEVYGVRHDSEEYAEGVEASSFVGSVMSPGTEVLIHTDKDKKSFNRYVAKITLPDGSDLGGVILESGHGEIEEE